jgi:hypothetical protein
MTLTLTFLSTVILLVIFLSIIILIGMVLSVIILIKPFDYPLSIIVLLISFLIKPLYYLLTSEKNDTDTNKSIDEMCDMCDIFITNKHEMINFAFGPSIFSDKITEFECDIIENPVDNNSGIIDNVIDNYVNNYSKIMKYALNQTDEWKFIKRDRLKKNDYLFIKMVYKFEDEQMAIYIIHLENQVTSELRSDSKPKHEISLKCFESFEKIYDSFEKYVELKNWDLEEF